MREKLIRLWAKPSTNLSVSFLLQVVHHSHKQLLKPELCSWHNKATRCHTYPQCFRGTHLYQHAAQTPPPREETIPWFAALLAGVSMCSLQTLKPRRAVCRLGQMLISVPYSCPHTALERGICCAELGNGGTMVGLSPLDKENALGSFIPCQESQEKQEQGC